VKLTRLVATTLAAIVLSVTSASATVVADWNDAILAELRLGKLGPPVAARALAIAHTCMYDAWAAYDDRAVGTVLGGALRRPTRERTDANKHEAVSFAAYRCLVNLFPAPEAVERLTHMMRRLGYDPAEDSTRVRKAAGVGNRAAAAVIEARRHDGANQYGDRHPGAYSDWTGYRPRNSPMAFCTPLIECLPLDVDDPNHWQPLINDAGVLQTFVAPHWGRVKPFSFHSPRQFDYIVPPPEYMRSPRDYHRHVDEILEYSRRLNAKRKLIVEYWADGPNSELPPGHWGLFAQFVSARDDHTIDEDAKMFFAMHNASFDAGIVAWHFKRKYDGVRPITAIRFVKEGHTVRAWGGPGRPIEKIRGEKWTPYNPGSNLTPAFPGYYSGHSTYSRASAEILTLFTGSDYFGFSTVIPADFGRVEPGIPAVPTTLSFRTFRDAAESAGLSRLYGGIHFSDDNTVGQAIGILIGWHVWRTAQTYFDGTAPHPER
jgi:hypothetical protein